MVVAGRGIDQPRGGDLAGPDLDNAVGKRAGGGRHGGRLRASVAEFDLAVHDLDPQGAAFFGAGEDRAVRVEDEVPDRSRRCAQEGPFERKRRAGPNEHDEESERRHRPTASHGVGSH